jgi:hypothetical protein
MLLLGATRNHQITDGVGDTPKHVNLSPGCTYPLIGTETPIRKSYIPSNDIPVQDDSGVRPERDRSHAAHQAVYGGQPPISSIR